MDAPKDLNNLRLFIAVPPKRESGITINPYRWLLRLESLIGIQRITIVDGIVRPPSLFSRFLSFILLCGLLFVAYLDVNQTVHLLYYDKYIDVNDSAEITLPSWLIIFCSILTDTVFLKGKKSARLFEIIKEIDDQLNIPEDHDVLRCIELTNNIAGGLIVLLFIMISVIWLILEFPLYSLIHISTSMSIFELELMICGCLLASIQIRLRHLTAHIQHKLTLYEQLPVIRDVGRRLLSLNFGPHHVDSKTITFDLNFNNVYVIYGKLLEAFELVNTLFNLQVTVIFAAIFVNMLMTIYSYLTEARNSEEYHYAAFVGWCGGCVLSFVFPCVCVEAFYLAAEDFRKSVLALCAEPRYEEHHPAAVNLLRYCDASEPRFSVYGLFYVSVSLPFNFLQLVATHVIVLLQLSF